MNLKDFRKDIGFTVRKNSSLENVGYMVRHNYRFDYDVYLPTKKMNLQRGLVWCLDQKRELILSILKGIKLSNISIIIHRNDLNNYDDIVYNVIDGKQRLTTIFSFYNNEFTLLHNGAEYYYKDLSPDVQYVIESFVFIADIAYEYPNKLISDDNKIAWFEMINFTGTPQDKYHLDKLKL